MASKTKALLIRFTPLVTCVRASGKPPLRKQAIVHQVTTMLATSKYVLFPGHNYLLTTGPDDPDTLIITRALAIGVKFTKKNHKNSLSFCTHINILRPQWLCFISKRKSLSYKTRSHQGINTSGEYLLTHHRLYNWGVIFDKGGIKLPHLW